MATDGDKSRTSSQSGNDRQRLTTARYPVTGNAISYRARKTATSRPWSNVIPAIATNIEVYYCDPQSTWQRGSNENTDGLPRQYFPIGTDLSMYSVARPRP